MILPCKLFADCTLHETRQRRQDIDRRIYLTIMELPVDKNLPFRYVPSEIRNGMGDIYKDVTLLTQACSSTLQELTVVWHRQDGDLRDGPISSLHTACALINCG